MNLVKIADLLKNAPDQALMQEMQNPTGTAPSYMILSELQRRKKLRGSLMNNEPQTSVAEDMEAEASQAEQMGAAGLGSMGPAPMQQPQEMPQGFAQGGAVQGYAYGGDVDYQDDLPWDERMRMWREMTGFGRMAPPPAPAQPTFPGAAAAQVRAADNRIVANNPDLTKTRSSAPKADVGIRAVAPASKQATTTTPAEDPLMAEMKAIGAEQKTAYQKLADTYQQQADEIKNQKSTDVGLALMQAGFGIAGGRSQNALENIGQGAMPAIQQYAGMDRARREQLQKLAMGQGQLGLDELGARQKGLGMQGELGLKREELGIKRQEVADKGAYQRGILDRTGAAASMKMDPRVIAQTKAIEDEINDTIKLSEGLYGKQKEVAMTRINALRQQKNKLLNLGGLDTGGTGAISGVRDYSEFMRP